MGAAAIGALVGALAIGLVFAGYAIGHRSEDSSSGASRLTTGAALNVQQILKTVQPSVVSILTGHTTTFYDSAGSGVVISTDGLILTNNHVIEDAKQITVKFNDGSQATATLVGASPDNDIALIKANQTGTVPADLGSSKSLRVGDDVVAIGNALNLGGAPSVTRGIISATNRSLSTPTESLDHLIQTDAAINHGNSGGPLINAKGEVVGINTAIFENAQSIGFSIAIDSVKSLIKDLKNGKGLVSPDEAFLGVQTVDVDAADLDQAVKDQFGVTAADGAFITQVSPNTAAEDAGLQEGDVIVEIEGENVATAQDVADAIESREPGDRVDVTVERAGRRRSFVVTLRKRGG
jgi:serine protease Do